MTVSWLSQGEKDVLTSLDWLGAREAERAARMRYPKRRNEFLLARWTAKCALARALELPPDAAALARVEIRNAPSGAPEAFVDAAPVPLAVSITDRAGWAVCAVRGGAEAIGCDLELVEPRSPAFVADYLTESEQRTVLAASEQDRPELANLIWSAKESALKVLRTGLRRDTRSVEVRLEGGAPEDGWLPLWVQSEEGRRFPGWWRRFGLFLLTIAAEVEIPPPVAIVHPPGLAGGVPSESWLEGHRW